MNTASFLTVLALVGSAALTIEGIDVATGDRVGLATMANLYAQAEAERTQMSAPAETASSQPVLQPTTGEAPRPAESSAATVPPPPERPSMPLEPIQPPPGCFDSDCDFTINVDSGDSVDEGPSGEGNNSVRGVCLG